MNNTITTYGRRSIRLKDYDYSSPGAYHVNICVQDRKCILGKIIDGMMVLSKQGEIVNAFITQITRKYTNVIIDTYGVMPNHVHIIIIINPTPDPIPFVEAIYESPSYTGAIGCAASSCAYPEVGRGRELPLRNPEQKMNQTEIMQRRKMLIPKIVGYFSMNTSKRINILQGTTGNRVWQRNYYEHIIRDGKGLNRIRQYIINNPLKWELDRNNPVHKKIKII